MKHVAGIGSFVDEMERGVGDCAYSAFWLISKNEPRIGGKFERFYLQIAVQSRAQTKQIATLSVRNT